ncbi:hypothetical protein BDF21DRAFT_361307, partial [Thamnidium elegans]
MNNYHSNISIILNESKRGLSPSPSISDSSISSVEVKRAKKIAYFLGQGNKKWVTKEKLIVDGIDITDALNRFRKHSIKEAEKTNSVNGLRVLSLSHIFPINKFTSSKSVAEYFKEETRQALFLLAGKLRPSLPIASVDAIVHCKNLVDEIEEKNDKMENDLMTIMVKDLASYVCKHNVSIPMSSEASFSEKYIMPAVRRILLENADKNIVYSLVDKPDFMIGAKKKRKM